MHNRAAARPFLIVVVLLLSGLFATPAAHAGALVAPVLINNPSPESLYEGFRSTHTKVAATFRELREDLAATLQAAGPLEYDWRPVTPITLAGIAAVLPAPAVDATRVAVDNNGLLVVTELTRSGTGTVWTGARLWLISLQPRLRPSGRLSKRDSVRLRLRRSMDRCRGQGCAWRPTRCVIRSSASRRY